VTTDATPAGGAFRRYVSPLLLLALSVALVVLAVGLHRLDRANVANESERTDVAYARLDAAEVEASNDKKAAGTLGALFLIAEVTTGGSRKLVTARFRRA
jgi:hypothetical protein